MKRIVYMLAASLLLATAFSFTFIPTWKIKDDYSIKFSSKDVNGIFRKFSGTVIFDETNLPGSSFSLAIDVASVNTGNGLQNKHAKSAEWFDATAYPQIKFNSSRIEKSGNGYAVKGTMEIHGVKKEISIPFSFSKKGDDAVFTSAFIIKRSDYKVGKPGGDVSEDIVIDVKVPVKK